MLIPSCTDVAWVSTCGSSDVEGLVCAELVEAVYVSVWVVVREGSVLGSCSLGYLVIGAGQLPDEQRRGVLGSGIRGDCRGVRVDVVSILW